MSRRRGHPDADFRALRLMMEAHLLIAASRPDLAYSSAEELVLRAGRRWPYRPLDRAWGPLSKWGAPKACFANSVLAAFWHEDLRYVEGFAYAGQIPVHHAWNVDRHNRVLDFTWREHELLPKQGRAYMGVVVPIERAWKYTWHEDATVLTHRDALTVPWTEDTHPPRPTREQFLAWAEDAGGQELRDLADQRLAS